MTPCEWLAWIYLASVAYGAVEHLIDPDAVRVTVNNPLAGWIRVSFVVALVVAALGVVL